MGAATSKNGVKITKQDRAILDLKLQRDKLQTTLDLQKRLAAEALSKSERSKALRALRNRKYQEQLLVKTDGQLETLEGLVSSIEFSLIEVSVVHGLKQGNSVLKEIHKEVNVENVQKLMSETQEAVAYQKEVDEMLATHMTAEEEEAVLKELAELQAEVDTLLAGRARPAKANVELPSAPSTEPVGVPSSTETETEEAVVVEEESGGRRRAGEAVPA